MDVNSGAIIKKVMRKKSKTNMVRVVGAMNNKEAWSLV